MIQNLIVQYIWLQIVCSLLEIGLTINRANASLDYLSGLYDINTLRLRLHLFILIFFIICFKFMPALWARIVFFKPRKKTALMEEMFTWHLEDCSLF